MGGPLIAKILNDGKDKLVNHPRLILQSNIQTQALRQTLNKLHMKSLMKESLRKRVTYMKSW